MRRLGILLSFCVMAGLVGCGSEEPVRDVATRFFQAVDARKWGEAWSLLDSADRQAIDSLELGKRLERLQEEEILLKGLPSGSELVVSEVADSLRTVRSPWLQGREVWRVRQVVDLPDLEKLESLAPSGWKERRDWLGERLAGKDELPWSRDSLRSVLVVQTSRGPRIALGVALWKAWDEARDLQRQEIGRQVQVEVAGQGRLERDSLGLASLSVPVVVRNPLRDTVFLYGMKVCVRIEGRSTRPRPLPDLEARVLPGGSLQGEVVFRDEFLEQLSLAPAVPVQVEQVSPPTSSSGPWRDSLFALRAARRLEEISYPVRRGLPGSYR